MKCRLLLTGLLLSLSACGSGEPVDDFDASVATQAPPLVTRINPNNGRAGDTITVFGLGFSIAPGNNIITVGGSSTAATAYALVNPPAAGEIESLTFTVPAGATAGATTIFVTVLDNTSNNNVPFTVNP